MEVLCNRAPVPTPFLIMVHASVCFFYCEKLRNVAKCISYFSRLPLLGYPVSSPLFCRSCRFPVPITPEFPCPHPLSSLQHYVQKNATINLSFKYKTVSCNPPRTGSVKVVYLNRKLKTSNFWL